MNTSLFKQKADSFIDKIFLNLKQHQVELEAHWDIDHLCYRTESLESYESTKLSFLNFSELLTECDVNGRPITTFKLHQPVESPNGAISVVEVPAPKAGKVIPEGFDHIEVVCDLPLNLIRQKYSHLRQDLGGLKKSFNAEIELCFESCSLKFHHMSLESVIRLEKNKLAWSALNSSRILDLLKKFHPEVVGTIPLDIATAESDIDIIIECEDFTPFTEIAESQWSDLPHYSLKYSEIENQASCIVSFTFEGVPFEIFAQATTPTQQTAFRHFQVEERLLKIGGEKLKRQIQNLRREGLKTEAAFSQVLNLSGNPYDQLLTLTSLPNNALAKLLKSTSMY